ncbi:MAG: hypothetical protein KH015_03735 [Gordonibacter pamelaeae]|nr:hypothetical protein [Gordonibacter pamelaeae]MBS4894891.1 hypothetical protein [Gordonibacter pamelaeae]MCB6312432.1 hypothetical protein [Gordonibacter pamelaeae]
MEADELAARNVRGLAGRIVMVDLASRSRHISRLGDIPHKEYLKMD